MLDINIKNKIIEKLNIDFPEYVMEQLEYCFVDGNKNNLDSYNIYYKFKNGPIENKDVKGYYWIPYHSKYIINKQGKVYNILTKGRLKIHITKSSLNNKKNISHGYNNVGVKNDLCKSSNGLHRLLAYAFIPYNNNPMKPYTLYVNHINGKPGDDRLENLEWTTPRENLIHAINNGLMPNSVTPIDMKNIITGETLSFRTVTKAAEYLQWTKSRIYHRLTKNNRLYPDMWIFKYQELDWPNIDKTITRMGVRRKIVSVNTITNEVVHHANIMRAAAYTGVNTTSISWAAKQDTGKPVKDIKFYFLENYK